MATQPTIEQIDAEIARREALARGETYSTITPEGAPAPQPVQTETIQRPANARPGLPVPGLEAPVEGTTTQGETTYIPDKARPPGLAEVEAEIDRRLGEQKAGREMTLWPGGPKTPTSLRPVQNALSGFNGKLADAFGYPVDAIDGDLRRLGTKLFDKPGSAKAAVREFFNDVGVGTDAHEGFSKRVGEETFNAAVTSAAFLAAAPYIVATKAGGAVKEVVKNMARLMRANPGLTFTQELGSGIGAREAKEAGAGPMGILGAAFVGGGAASLLQGGARRVAGAFGDALTPTPRSGPVRPSGDVRETRIAGQKLIDDTRRNIDAQIKATLDGISTSTTPLSVQDQQVAFRSTLDAARATVRQQEQALWAQTPTGSFEPAQLVASTRALNRSIPNTVSEGRPSDFINRVETLFAPRKVVDEISGQTHVIRPKTTIQALTALRHEAMDAAATASATGNRTLAANLTRFSETVMRQIDAAFPADPAIKAARDFSREFNTLFNRGALRRVLGRSGDRGVRVEPEVSMERLLSHPMGARQVEQASARYTLPQLQADAEASIRSLFRREVETATPERAAKIMADFEPRVRTMGRLGGELRAAVDDLAFHHANRKALEASALMKYVGQDPQNAIANLYSAADPVRAARNIMQSLGHDQNAITGLQSGVVDHFLRQGLDGNGMLRPSALDRTLRENADVGRLLNEVLGSQNYFRLRQDIGLALRLENGDRKVGQKAISAAQKFPITMLVARIFGAQVGRTVARYTGGGTVQTPAIISQATRNWAEDLIRGIPAGEYLTRAIVDPKWEAALISKVPTNTPEIRAALRAIRLLIRVDTAQENVNVQKRERKVYGEVDE